MNTYGVGVYFSEYPSTYSSSSTHVYCIRKGELASCKRAQTSWWRCEGALVLRVVKTVHKGSQLWHMCSVAHETSAVEHGTLRQLVGTPDRKGSTVLGRQALQQAEAFLYGTAPAWIQWVVRMIARVLEPRVVVYGRKWQWLLHFLTGKGTPMTAPVEGWNSGQVVRNDDGSIYIRPSQHTELFWLVGGMTLQQQEDGTLEGVDEYDFHPQAGQNTILNRDDLPAYAWSGGSQDQTQVRVEKLPGVAQKAILWLGHRSHGLIRVVDGRVEVSNRFWNWLGGKPFQTIVRVEH